MQSRMISPDRLYLCQNRFIRLRHGNWISDINYNIVSLSTRILYGRCGRKPRLCIRRLRRDHRIHFYSSVVMIAAPIKRGLR
jgi:hypothetical protein